MQPSFSHQPPPPTSLNGYTFLETFSKFPAADDPRHMNILAPSISNSPVSNLPSSVKTSLSGDTANAITNPITSPVNKGARCAEYIKDPIQQNNTADSISNTSHQANTNNHTIHGYVTQQQLANFGTNVALGK